MIICISWPSPPSAKNRIVQKKQQHGGLKFLPKTTRQRSGTMKKTKGYVNLLHLRRRTTCTNRTEQTGEGAMPGNVARQHNVVHYNTCVK